MAAIELNATPLLTDANLQGYWRLESNYTDTSSNGYTLTASGSPSDVTGKFGNGKSFDGTTYASIAQASSTDLPRAIQADATFSFWIYPNATPNVQYGILGYDNTSTDFYCFHWSGTSQKISFTVNAGGQPNRGVTTTTALSASTWYHIVGVNDNTNTDLKLWVNGVKEGEDTSASLAAGTNTSPFYVAKIPGVNATGTNAIFDDVAVFDRALTDTEVQNLYNGTWPNGNFLAFL